MHEALKTMGTTLPIIIGQPGSQYHTTAAIKSLLTHICIPVALNIVVHPRLTYEH